MNLDARIRDLASSDSLLVALDFDGCLAPFNADPMKARMLPESHRALATLAQLPHTDLALISGRKLPHLVQLAEPPVGTYLAGSHGAERGHVESNGRINLTPARLSDSEQTLLARLRNDLEQIADAHPGTWLEFKDISVSLHTRGITDRSVASAAMAAAETGPATLQGVRRRPGHEVLELAVVQITKGDALSDFQNLMNPTRTLYAGDDVTDEDAFAILREPDLSIRVGEGETVAQVRLADPQAIAVFLTDLVSQRQKHPHS